MHAREWPKQNFGGYGVRMKLGPDLLERMKRLFRFHPVQRHRSTWLLIEIGGGWGGGGRLVGKS